MLVEIKRILSTLFGLGLIIPGWGADRPLKIMPVSDSITAGGRTGMRTPHAAVFSGPW